jgi:peptide/nickel transport system permease protein
VVPWPPAFWSRLREALLFNYLVRRGLYVIPLVLGVSLLVFVLFNLVGGDPTYLIAGKNATEEQIADLRAELGFNKPLLHQFTDQLKQQVTFDFGRSLITHQRISSMLASGVVPSLCLTVPPFIFGLLLSVTVALLVCYYRGSMLDRSVVILTVAGMSITPLAYILAGQYVLAYKWDLFPITGWEYPEIGWAILYNTGTAATSWHYPFIPDFGQFFYEFGTMLSYLYLPWMIWIVTGLGSDVRFYRTVLLDEVSQDYVRTARAKGLSEPKVFFKMNAMIPIITSVVIRIPYLYTGSLLLENFFGIPGLGSMAINGINNSDFPVVKAVTLIGSLLFIVFNLISDVCYAVVDPRVKLG